MQTKGFHFSNAITFGRASYVATGRGFQMETLSLAELYSRYAQSHICLGFEIACMNVLFHCTSHMPFSWSLFQVWPGWLVVVALMLSPWWFNPGALTFPGVVRSFREWHLWIDNIGDFKAAQGKWYKWHRDQRMKMVRESPLAQVTRRYDHSHHLHHLHHLLHHLHLSHLPPPPLAQRFLLAIIAAVPRMIIFLSCCAYLRSSRTLEKMAPSYAVLLSTTGVVTMVALTVLYHLVHVIASRLLQVCGQEQLKFLVTQLFKAVVLTMWWVVNARAWEEMCWQFSCTEGRAQTESCHMWPFATTGDLLHIKCENHNTTGTAPRSCARRCFMPRQYCVGGADYDVCAAANSLPPYPLGLTPAELVRGDDGVVASAVVEAGWSENKREAFLACFTATAVESPRESSYLFCLGQQPPLTIVFVASVAVTALLVQWVGMLRLPHKKSLFYPIALAIQDWADFYYQLADKVVGLTIISMLFLLTMLPLATLQSTILFKASFGKVLARRMRKDAFLESMVSA